MLLPLSMIKKFPSVIDLHKIREFLSLMPQHYGSIRSALCINNDPSLIGMAARIPYNVPQHYNSMHKAKEGLRGEFALCIQLMRSGW